LALRVTGVDGEARLTGERDVQDALIDQRRIGDPGQPAGLARLIPLRLGKIHR
jgi:hypothetical protein